MILILTRRRNEFRCIIAGRITQCADSDDSDIDWEEEGGK